MVEEELEVVKIENNIVITKEDVITQVPKVPSWNSPGLDCIQGFWLKILGSVHQTIDDILKNEQSASIPEWMVESGTVLIQKDPTKGNSVGNYIPIACLNLFWKLLTGVTTDNLNEHLENQDLLPD